MGEAAEWDIWRRYGVDISDDGYLENPPKRKRRKPRPIMEGSALDPDLTGIRSFDDAAAAAADHGWECPSVKEARHYEQKYGGTITGRMSSKGPAMHELAKVDMASLEDRIALSMAETIARQMMRQSEAKSGYYMQGAEPIPAVHWDMTTAEVDDTLAQGVRLGYWRKGDGKIIAVTDMDDRHLQNTIAWTKRNGYHKTADALTKVRDRRASKEVENQMDTREIISIMQLEAGARLIGVAFEGSDKVYTFKDVLQVNPAVGDQVVVEGRFDGLSLGVVKEVDVNPATITCGFAALKHVVSKVDASGLDRIRKQETEARNKLAMAEVTQRLDGYRKQFGGVMDQAASVLLGKADPVPSFRTGWDKAAGADSQVEVVVEGGEYR